MRAPLGTSLVVDTKKKYQTPKLQRLFRDAPSLEAIKAGLSNPDGSVNVAVHPIGTDYDPMDLLYPLDMLYYQVAPVSVSACLRV